MTVLGGESSFDVPPSDSFLALTFVYIRFLLALGFPKRQGSSSLDQNSLNSEYLKSAMNLRCLCRLPIFDLPFLAQFSLDLLEPGVIQRVLIRS